MRNKFLKIKHSKTKIIATFVLLLFIVVYACREEFDDSLVAGDEKKAIEHAKLWYEANKPDVLTFRASNGKDKVKLEPKWDKSSAKNNDKYEVIEAPITSDLPFCFFDEACLEKYDKTQDMRYLLSKTTFVLRKGKKTDIIEGFLMTIVPDLSYLESSRFDPFKKNSYLDRDKKFSGHIFYNNMDGSFANGWKYIDGKAYVITPEEEGEDVFQLRAGGCTLEVVYYDIELCSPISEYTNGLLTEIGISCRYYTTFFVYNNCGGIGDGGNGDYQGGNGASGGNGGINNGSTNDDKTDPKNRTDCPPEAAANSNKTNSVLNSSTGGNAQVKSNVDKIRDYAKNSSNEFALIIDKIGNQYTVFDQNQNSKNPLYIKEGTTDKVGYIYGDNAYMLVHSHSLKVNAALSPLDAISLVEMYKGRTQNGYTVKALNVLASVILCYNGSEYMIYVNNRDELKDFCKNQMNSNFFEPNGSEFKSKSLFEEYYDNAKKSLLNQGYSEIDAKSYALSHVLEWFKTGLTISKKEPGKSDFKEQKTEYKAVGQNVTYTPKICQ